MTRQHNRTTFAAIAMSSMLTLASATLLLGGCVAGEVGGRAIDLVGHGSDGVLPLRQSTSCGCGGGGGGTYPGYPSNPYPNDPSNPYPNDPNNAYPPQTPPPSTPQTPPSTPGGPANPGPTGNYGAVCQQASDCTSGPCVRGPDGVAFCTAQCTPNSNICPAEAGCHATSVANMYVCGKPSTPNGGNSAPPPQPTQPQNDQAAPVVYITSPLTGSTVASQVMVKANVSDNVGLKIVELYVDGTLASSTSAGPFEFPVTLQPGKHLITLRATDTSSNSTDAQATVTVAASGDPGSPTGPGTPTTPGPSAPLGALNYGQSCSQPGDCASGMCANDVSIGLQYCSQTCLPGAGACPAGSGCYAANAGVYVCAVDSAPGAPQQNSGGLGTQTQGAASCSVGASPSSTAPAALVLLGLALLGMRRRRRR